MARPKNSPEKIEKMRNDMMDAVIDLLDEVSPEKVSIRMIAEKIGVSHMVFYTYFKDFKGDRRTGKRTLVVLWGLRRSRIAAVFLAFLPVATFLALRSWGLLARQVSGDFLTLGAFSVSLQVWTGILFFLRPVGKATYTALGVDFTACVCAETTLIALFDSALAVRLFVISFCTVNLLFLLHRNAKA